MPGTAKNPGNPYAAAVDALDPLNLLVILEYIEHRGGPSKLASLSIGKIPGMLPVMHYIDHERSIDNRPGDVFDFFHLDRGAIQTGVLADMQAVVHVLDDSEESGGAASHHFTACLPEELAAEVVDSQVHESWQPPLYLHD